MRGTLSISHCIIISTFLAPFAVEKVSTMIFDEGLVWYFPVWQFVHGSGESGSFAFLLAFGIGGFLAVYLNVIMTVVLVVTGMILAEFLRRATNGTESYTLGRYLVFATLIIEISVSIVVILPMLGDFWVMYLPIFPLPIPSILGMVGLRRIRRGPLIYAA